MGVDDGIVHLDWRILALAMLLSGGAGGATTKLAIMGYPPADQVMTRSELDSFVRRDELLRELRAMQSQLSQIDAKLQVTADRQARADR